jgi:hypothetical protein
MPKALLQAARQAGLNGVDVQRTKAGDRSSRWRIAGRTPARFLDERAGELEDRMDLDFKYPRATPEKALLDWIYLGASARTKIAGPPFDIDAGRLKKARLQRLARAMGLQSKLKMYFESKGNYDEDPEVKAN